MDIPVIYQYYPSLPLSELSDLYAPGNNTLATKKICLISYLPKVLRIDPEFPFTNTYVLLLQDTATVDSIDWEVKLFGNGQPKTDPAFVTVNGNHTNRFTLTFENDIFDFAGNIRYERLKVICKVKKGTEVKELSVEHSLIQMINTKEVGLFTGAMSTPAGDPITTNYLVNHLADYFTQESVIWNNNPVEPDFSHEHTLMKIVQSIIYDNLVTAQTHLLKSPLFYDFAAYRNNSFESMINDNETEYEGEFTSGICHLPLHILSDVLGPQNEVPDFLNINTGNKVYSMIVYDQFFAVNTVEDDFLMTIPQKIAESKERLADNKTRAREIYHLSQFPKAAIKMTAILVKYLFECSRKNECKDCKNRFVTWPYLGLDNLKDNQDFLRNTLTHYYNGPTNTIDNFAERAMKTTRLVWSPPIYTIANMHPRIVTAYFAKRIISKIDIGRDAAGNPISEFIFDFERIDNSQTRIKDNGTALTVQPDYDTVLGRETFLVVETTGCRGKNIVVSVKPHNNSMTGNINNLELKYNGNYLTEFTATVGNFEALNTTTTNAIDGTIKTQEYLQIDHKDKAIVKMELRPSTQALFNTWQSGNTATGVPGLRASMGEFHIHVKRADNKVVFYGNGADMAVVNGEFLNAYDKYNSTARLRVGNFISFEIMQEHNRYKLRTSANVVVDKIGMITNAFVDSIDNDTPESAFRRVAYFYHDALGNVHDLGAPFMVKALQKEYPVKWTAPLPHRGNTVGAAISYAANRTAHEEIDAITLQQYDNGTYVEGRIEDYSTNTPNHPDDTKWYANTTPNVNVDLVNTDIANLGHMDANAWPGLDYERRGVRIRFDFMNTRRRFAKAKLFAGVLGAVAKLYETKPTLTLITQGFAFFDASCYPSKEHINGDAIDTNYFYPLAADTQPFITAMIYYGFRRFRIGKNMGTTFNNPYAGVAVTFSVDPPTSNLHTGHLHSTNYSDPIVQTINI